MHYVCPGRVFYETSIVETHTIPFIIHLLSYVEEVSANNFRNSMGQVEKLLSFVFIRHRHIHRHIFIAYYFLAKSSFLKLTCNSLCWSIIVIIKVKYSSNLGWYSRSSLYVSKLCRCCFFLRRLRLPSPQKQLIVFEEFFRFSIFWDEIN